LHYKNRKKGGERGIEDKERGKNRGAGKIA
jgi:hypothetical protein